MLFCGTEKRLSIPPYLKGVVVADPPPENVVFVVPPNVEDCAPPTGIPLESLNVVVVIPPIVEV